MKIVQYIFGTVVFGIVGLDGSVVMKNLRFTILVFKIKV